MMAALRVGVRRTLALAATALLVVSLVLSALRLTTPDLRIAVLAVTFAPYALVTYAVSLLVWLALRPGAGGRRRAGVTAAALVALAGIVLHLSWLAPLYLGRRPTGTVAVSLLTVNTLKGNADAGNIVSLARRNGVQVLVLEEVRAAELARLDAAGLGRLLPHRYGGADAGVAGTIVFSTWRLTRTRRLPVDDGVTTMRVAAPSPFTLFAVHTAQPVIDAPRWRADHAVILREVARTQGDLVLAGDFNATLDHRPIRLLQAAGVRDAASEADSGYAPTWPSNGRAEVLGVRVSRPLITIDHVMVRGTPQALATRTVLVPGTDHRGLLARISRP